MSLELYLCLALGLRTTSYVFLNKLKLFSFTNYEILKVISNFFVLKMWNATKCPATISHRFYLTPFVHTELL